MAHIAELLQVAKLGNTAEHHNILKRRAILGGITMLGMAVVGLSLRPCGRHAGSGGRCECRDFR